MLPLKLLVTLAWRNVWRQRGRSVMTVAAVAVVVTITMTFFGLTGAARNGIYVSVTRAAGHLQVHVADYRNTRRLRDLLIDDGDALVRRLHEALPEADITALLSVPALIESEGRSYGILLQGRQQSDAARERFAAEYLAAGSLPADDDLESIALGEKLAANLKVTLGDTVYLYAPESDGLGAAAYTVTAILSLPNSESLALSSLAAAQELAAPGAITSLQLTFETLVRETDDRLLPALLARAQEALGDGFTIEPWSRVNPDMAGFVIYFRRVSLVIAAIFFILAGLLVANTVYLGVLERIREFGVLHALGTPPRTVEGMVLFESAVLCAVGALAGLLAGALVVGLMARGVSFPPQIADFLVEQGLPRVFHASITAREVLLTMVFALITASVAALMPAVTAGRLEPAEAMRFTA